MSVELSWGFIRLSLLLIGVSVLYLVSRRISEWRFRNEEMLDRNLGIDYAIGVAIPYVLAISIVMLIVGIAGLILS